MQSAQAQTRSKIGQPNREIDEFVAGLRAAETARAQGYERRHARSAFRAAAFSAGLNVVGMCLDLPIVRSIPDGPTLPHLTSIAVAVGLLALLGVRWHQPTVRLGSAVFVVNALVIIAALWASNDAFANSGRLWVPFQANKLGMFTVALLAPGLWVGVVSILAYAAAAIVQGLTFSPVAQSHLAVGEPGATLAIATFAFALLAYRVRRDTVDQRAAQANEERAALVRLAHVLLEVRDLSNTPLQTITLATDLIRRAHPELQPRLAHIEHALRQLKELDSSLKVYEGHVIWEDDSSDQAARDASRVH